MLNRMQQTIQRHVNGRTVLVLLGLLAAGSDHQAILAEYPFLEREDVQAALAYAAALAEEEVVEFAR